MRDKTLSVLIVLFASVACIVIAGGGYGGGGYDSSGAKLPLSGGTMQGDLNMGTFNVTNAGDIAAVNAVFSGTISASGVATLSGGASAADSKIVMLTAGGDGLFQVKLINNQVKTEFLAGSDGYTLDPFGIGTNDPTTGNMLHIMGGNADVGGGIVSNATTGATTDSLATKGYVDNVIGSSNAPSGYSDGMWLTYSNASTVIIEPGEMYVDGTLYCLTTNYTLSITSAPSILTNVFVMLNSAAGSPMEPQFFDSLTQPTNDTTRNGEYIGDNRKVADLLTTNGTTDIVLFTYNSEGWLSLFGEDPVLRNSVAGAPTLLYDHNPDATYQPMDFEPGHYMPDRSTEIEIEYRASDNQVGGFYVFYSTPERTNLVASAAVASSAIYRFQNAASLSYNGWRAVTRLSLGLSQMLLTAGQDDDDAHAGVLTGWLVVR